MQRNAGPRQENKTPPFGTQLIQWTEEFTVVSRSGEVAKEALTRRGGCVHPRVCASVQGEKISERDERKQEVDDRNLREPSGEGRRFPELQVQGGVKVRLSDERPQTKGVRTKSV